MEKKKVQSVVQIKQLLADKKTVFYLDTDKQVVYDFFGDLLIEDVIMGETKSFLDKNVGSCFYYE